MNETLELPAQAGSVDVDKLDTAKPLDVIFKPYQTTLEKWEAKVDSLKVVNISQKTEMAQARLAHSTSSVLEMEESSRFHSRKSSERCSYEAIRIS